MKHESEAWIHSGESTMNKVRQQKSTGKVMLVAFFDCQGMAYQYVYPPKKRITNKYYKMVLEKVLDRIRWKQLELLQQWTYHQNYDRPHTAALVQEWLECHNIEGMKHPLYSLDIMPCNFWLFPLLKQELLLELQNRCSGDLRNPGNLWTHSEEAV